MLILQVASGNIFSTYGGGQIYVKNIVDEMIRQQYSIAVFSFLDDHTGVKKKNYKGISLYEIGEKGVTELKQLIQDIHPNVIHAHSQKSLMCTIGITLNIPVIVTSHHGGIVCPAGTFLNTRDEICKVSVCYTNCLQCVLRNVRSGKYWYPFMKMLPMKQYIYLGEYLKKKPFIPFITPIGQAALSIEHKKKEWQSIIASCTQMIAPSYAMKAAIVRNGFSERKVSVIPHGIPIPINVSSFPAIENEIIKFFYIGRICYVKGIHILLRAFNCLKESNVQLHLIGDAGNKRERRYMARLQQKYKKDTRIIWHGKVEPEQVFNEIRNMHVSISSSSCLEAFGLNIAESLAMGKPVLATRCGGAEMQIEDRVNGWLVDTNDDVALRKKMEDIIRDISIIPLMGMEGRKNVISIEEHCKTLVNLYERIKFEKEETSY